MSDAECINVGKGFAQRESASQKFKSWIHSWWGTGHAKQCKSSSTAEREGGGRDRGKEKMLDETQMPGPDRAEGGWLLGHSKDKVEHQVRASCLSPEHRVLACPVYTVKPLRAKDL